jgi:hypothetical protein
MGHFSFMEFMVEGGWGMWPILLLGMVTLTGAARYGMAPDRGWLRFVAVLWVTLLAAVAHATVTDLAAVCAHFEGTGARSGEPLAPLLLTGLKESTRPAALGGIFLTLVPLLAAIGMYREVTR